MNFGSTLFSLVLHGVVFVILWLWPSSPPIQLNKPVIQISLTMGAPGGDRLPSPVLGHRGSGKPDKPSAAAAPDKPADARQLAQPLPDSTRQAQPAARADSKPEAIRQKDPAPRPATDPRPAPQKQREEDARAVAISEKPKKKDEKKKDEKRDRNKPNEKGTSRSERSSGKSSDDVLKAALADARAKAGPESRRRDNSGAVARALAQASRNVNSGGGEGSGMGGGGGEGDGPGGGGLYDVYAGMVILSVRPNWSMPTYSRTLLVAHVRVRIDSNGKVLSATLEKGSGRADFDASAVNAVLRTKQLPKPPTPDQQDIIIAFNSLEMMGR